MKKLLLPAAIVLAATCMPSLSSNNAFACEKVATTTCSASEKKIIVKEAKASDEPETLNAMRTFPFALIN